MEQASAAACQQGCLRWEDIPPANAPGELVLCLASYDTGPGPLLYAGGYFTSAGGQYTQHVARWDGANWSALPGGGLGTGLNDSVRVFTEYHDPIAGHCLVAGGSFDFTTTNGGTAHSIAKWQGSGWSQFGPPNVWGANGTVESLVANGATLYIGGEFDSVDTTPATNIAQWDGTTWSALGGGVGTAHSYDGVLALAMFDDGQGPALYAGGSFPIAGGLPVRNLARWDGVAWTPVGVPPLDGTNGAISALAVFDDGYGPALYAGGSFTEAGGVSASHVAKWDGSTWSPLGGGLQGNASAWAVFDDGNGPRLHVGGYFFFAGGIPANGVAKWDGSTWSALGAGVGGNHPQVEALCSYGSTPRTRALYAAGQFIVAGALPARHFAAWVACETPVSMFCFGDGTVASCPCGNLGVGDHGCENSASTGGARLSFTGVTSPDSIVLHSMGELPSALSLVFQGDEFISSSVPFGDGLGCIGGNLKRLYVRNAAVGQLDAPTGSEPSITARSAALGDPIAPGETRYYQVYYRDPSSSFCAAPAGSTFNATSGIRISW